MKYGRTYNFSAGPAMMPEEVLEEIAAEMMNYRGSGMCVMEMSHRSKVFQQIRDEAEADLRQLMGIPDNYKVLFVQGGGTVQFAMVPMNLMKNGVACYVETGNWSKKAIKEAQKYGEVKIVASSADKNFSYIPDCSDLDIPDNADYVYICENETINGTTYFHLPNTKGKILVSDQSSMFLSRPCDVTKYGLIWAGVQKNVGPAGMAVVTHCFSTRLFLYPDPSLNAPLALSGDLGKALTEMSPAAQLAGGGSPTYSWAELAIGRFPGPIGATCIAVLAACALYLFTRRTASPLITLSFLAVCALSAILFPRLKDAAWQQSVMMELCSGYLLFAGIFLLNDPVTAPRHWLGRLLYGAFAGILVMALRYFGRFEDAACFAVLLVNAFAPILDRWSWRLVHTLTKGLRPAEEGGC